MKDNVGKTKADGNAEVQRVAVVILNWNGGNDILECIASVYDSCHSTIDVIVIDNGSVDGSSAIIKRRFPQVNFIYNSLNLGFAEGSNQGMQWALDKGIEYIVLLNGDARIDRNAIRELLAATQSADNSIIACPRIYLRQAQDAPKRLWFAYGTVKLWAGLFQNPAFNQEDSPEWSVERDMEYASGCCIMIPARILHKVGMLDKTFFAYCEDIDFSLRVRKAGFELRYIPKSLVWHGSNEKTDRTQTPTYRYLATRNNLWVVRKHGTPLEILTCLCILPFRSLFRVSSMIAKAQWSSIAAEMHGIAEGIFKPLTRS